ncbi:ABC transporter substrate-binding protein [Aquabacter sp. L1I39]|uniref:ABC transporter substrate-binding protein n=1 Tax=Aquabacter sp. L1I39 TaxID=2820278 RepID=UPI001FFD9094|nr:ABC transporter substrate-binding protein [Aquabacter sp. L1I39]
MKISKALFGATVLLASMSLATAEEIRIGATLSTTGPAASIGIPIKNTFQILPKDIAGVPVSWTILDDGTDTTLARRNVEKLAADNVDIIIGGNTTPTALAAVEVAGRTQTPMLAIAPSPAVIEPLEGARKWVFKVPLGERELAQSTLADMAKRGVKTFGFIGFNDAFGEGWLKEFERFAPDYGIKLIGAEKFARTDNSVVAQALKTMAARPDAVFVGATGTPAALPTLALRERGFKGPIYQASGVVNNDFLRVGGKAVEGVLVAGSPLVVSANLPDGHPSKAVSRAFVANFEAAYGPGSVSLFAGNAEDAWLLLQEAVKVALKSAKPGTPEFRAALRDALEQTKGLAVTGGVITLGPTNHGIYPPESAVVLTVKDGAWALAR